MEKLTNEKLYGKDLFHVFAEHINEEGWLTSDWGQIIEDEVPRYDEDFNDNPLHGETYNRMYILEYEENEDETMIRPLPNQFPFEK
jgi:hypothetical protein